MGAPGLTLGLSGTFGHESADDQVGRAHMLSGPARRARLGTVTISSVLDVRPLSPLIGAEIHGLDLAKPLSDDDVAAVRSTLNQYHVVFFRDQDLNPETQAAFASQFGTVTEGHPIIPAMEEHPEVLSIDGRDDRASWWHTDITF